MLRETVRDCANYSHMNSQSVQVPASVLLSGSSVVCPPNATAGLQTAAFLAGLESLRDTEPNPIRRAAHWTGCQLTMGVDQPFSQIIAKISGLIRRAILDHCPPDLIEDIEDIEQEARVRLWRAMGDGERDIEQPGRYAYRLAVNATLDAIRRARSKRRAVVKAELNEATVAGHDVAEQQASSAELLACIDTFVARQSRFVGLALPLHLQGLTTLEIGELLDCSEARARNQIYRSLKRLREHLLRHGFDYAP